MDGSQRSANLDAYSISRQGLPQRDPYGSGYGREASGGPRGSVAAPTEAELLNEYGAGSARPAPPGVGVPAPSRDPYGAAHVPYGGVPSSGARDPYGGAPGGGPSRDPYGGAPAGQGVRDPYSYGGPAQSFDPEEDEVQALKYQIRNTKQESLSSTRNAVRIARETEETATNTLLKLGDQSDKIGDTERSLDIAKAHASRAEDNARTIAQLNQSIFRPKFKRNKEAKRAAQEARLVQRHVDERTERELTRAEMMSSQKRVEESVANMGMFGRLRSKMGNGPATELDAKAQRERFQFEATESDDEMEDEIDGNLDEIAALSARMNMLSRAMGQEVGEQNKRLQRVSDKTTSLDTRIYADTKRLEALR